ncbi:MAG TPA: GNAT family N-acetyltransferase [Anaeromyxobacter sp.]|nr:GNAT family N-acetyltransferase [Anaeromyxobacter sp.]
MLRTADTGGTAARGAAPYRVEEVRGRPALAALRAEWEGVAARGPTDLPFVSHAWLSAWLDAFAPGRAPLVLVARGPGGAAAGFAPFLEERRRGVVRLVAPANDHSCRVEWVLGQDASGAAASIWAHLRDRCTWDALVLRDVPRDGATSTLVEALARADGHLTGRWESLRTPRIALGGTPAEERTTAKFRANLRRRARRLGELGAVALQRVDGRGGEAEVDAAVDAFLRLEASGWKGERGTAVALDPAIAGFYRRMAHDAAGRGALAIRALLLDGRPIAVHLGIVHRGVYLLPKTAYEESLGNVSPGQLLQREVLAECEARGLSGFDFLGPDMPWKRDWAGETVPHDWLYVYRPSLAGRAMHTLKHRVRPAAKEVLAWWR